MVAIVVLIAIAILALGYVFYGKFLSNIFGLDNKRITPAHEMNDGVDYVPAKASMLLSQHFSAISAAGPIAGPILAAMWFGWLPALLWIIFGTIFIGGVHDFGSLIASVRNKASSIGEIVKQHMSKTSQMIFLIFVWFALVYVIIAFTDITAQTFRTAASFTAGDTTTKLVIGPSVVVSSFMYLILGIVMGILLYKFKMPLGIATAVFVPLVLVIIYASTMLPAGMSDALMKMPVKGWEIILIVYCFIASLIPMWLLLQPRGYLGGWFLYVTMGVALLGALFGGFVIKYPMLTLNGLASIDNGKLVFPILFITVACGACSGFHGIVSSGTTSKQIEKETDTRVVGYGAMILEGIVAVLALATVMMLAKSEVKDVPNLIFAKGIAQYIAMGAETAMKLLTHVFPGLSAKGAYAAVYGFALTFALTAFSTFVYDTLDVTTRLARYILQELTGMTHMFGAVIATAITLALPLAFLMTTKDNAYLDAWPLFGTSNQLLASLILLAVSVWLSKTGKNAVVAFIPMLFMFAVTIWALVLQVIPFYKAIPGMKLTALSPAAMISGACGTIIFILSIIVMIEGVKVLAVRKAA